MMLLGLALLLQVGTQDLAPAPKVAAGVKLDTADKSFSIAAKSTADHDLIVKALEGHLDAVKACWTKELAAHPRAHGTLSFAFSVLPDGSLSRPVLKSDSVNDKGLVDCASRAIAAINVPLQDQTVRVVAPFVFTNGSETAAAEPGASPTPEGEAAIDDVLSKSHSVFNNCWVMAKKKDSRAQGTVVVDFTVEESGIVRDATISGGTMRSMPMNDCVAKQFRRLKFPPPSGGRIQLQRTMTFPPAK